MIFSIPIILTSLEIEKPPVIGSHRRLWKDILFKKSGFIKLISGIRISAQLVDGRPNQLHNPP